MRNPGALPLALAVVALALPGCLGAAGGTEAHAAEDAPLVIADASLLHSVPQAEGLIAGSFPTESPVALVPSRQVSAAPIPPPGNLVVTVDVAGRERSAVVHIPPGLDAPGIPLLVLLHPALASGALMQWASKMDAEADAGGFIVAYPDGTPDPMYAGWGSWNAGYCCGAALDSGSADVEFIAALIERLLQDYPIDPAHVGLAGHSNGGMLAHQIASAHGDLVSSLMVVGGSIGGRVNQTADEVRVPAPAVPLSVLIVHAVDDPIVPYGGGNTLGPFEPERVNLGVAEAVDLWLAADGLQATSPTTSSSFYIQKEWTGGLAGTDVVFITRTGGHGWSDPASAVPPYLPLAADLDVTALVADFFLAHPRLA